VKRIAALTTAACAIAALLVVWGDAKARADPIGRDLRIVAAVPTTTLVLLSDIHVAGPDMPPDRLAAIVMRFGAPPDMWRIRIGR
jgi:hypothetical protein